MNRQFQRERSHLNGS